MRRLLYAHGLLRQVKAKLHRVGGIPDARLFVVADRDVERRHPNRLEFPIGVCRRIDGCLTQLLGCPVQLHTGTHERCRLLACCHHIEPRHRHLDRRLPFPLI